VSHPGSSSSTIGGAFIVDAILMDRSMMRKCLVNDTTWFSNALHVLKSGCAEVE